MSGTGEGSDESGFAGQASPTAGTSEFNALQFVIDSSQGLVSTCAIVRIEAVRVDAEISPVGVVDVTPLVNLMDGIGRTQKHGKINNLPFFRLQGGTNAVVIDPVVGDIGIAIFTDRDSSAVKSAKAQANPGSYRRHDMADGLYLGGFLNGTPTQYILFREQGMKIVDSFANVIETKSEGITINGVLFDRDGNMSNVGTLDATGEGTFDGHSVGAHTHGGVASGSADTDPPTG